MNFCHHSYTRCHAYPLSRGAIADRTTLSARKMQANPIFSSFNQTCIRAQSAEAGAPPSHSVRLGQARPGPALSTVGHGKGCAAVRWLRHTAPRYPSLARCRPGLQRVLGLTPDSIPCQYQGRIQKGGLSLALAPPQIPFTQRASTWRKGRMHDNAPVDRQSARGRT